MAVGSMNYPENPRGNILLIAQEITFAKILAGNDKKLRDRGVKRLRKWLSLRSRGTCEFTNDDFMRIWKGLFYCMWMADKLLVQEELAETISSLIHCFKKTNQAVSFIQCFFQTMVTEWYGIDQFRYDKFMMLVRRFLRQTFELCRKCQWNADVIEEVCKTFNSTILSVPDGMAKNPPLSLVQHFCEIYLQELSKVGRGKLPGKMVTAFLQPFILYMTVQERNVLRSKVKNDVFYYLMKQSDLALAFEEKWEAWKKAGCPGDSWRDMELVEEEDGEVASEMSDSEMVEDGPLDPRAGRVNVELPQLQFDSRDIADAIQQQVDNCKKKKFRHALTMLAERFSKMAEGTYPLAKRESEMKTHTKPDKFELKKHVEKAVSRLAHFEKTEGKKKRKRRRKSGKKLDQGSGTKSQSDTALAEEGALNGNSDAGVVQMQADETTHKVEPDRAEVQNDNVSNDSSNLVTEGDAENGDSKSVVMEVVTTSSDLDAMVMQNAEESTSKTPTVTKVFRSQALKVESPNKSIKNAKDMETELGSLPDSAFGSAMKRKCGFLLSDLKEMDMGLSHLKVGKEELSGEQTVVKNTPSKRRLSVEGRKGLTPVRRRRVSGTWDVSDVKEDKSKSGKAKVTTPASTKKVNIALNKNSAQDLRQYRMSIIQSPEVPFDASKKPSQGVLKASSVTSPINPFYRLKGKMRRSSCI